MNTLGNINWWDSDDVDTCEYCGAPLPLDIKPGSVQDQGYCSARCAKLDSEITSCKEY
jgi:uncharacterized cysteine cluster protein YcgN (CxxCxxCC family)